MKYFNLILNETNLSSDENYNSYELTTRERKIFSNLKQKEDEEFSVNFSKTWLSKNSFEMLRNKNVCEFCKSIRGIVEVKKSEFKKLIKKY